MPGTRRLKVPGGIEENLGHDERPYETMADELPCSGWRNFGHLRSFARLPRFVVDGPPEDEPEKSEHTDCKECIPPSVMEDDICDDRRRENRSER